MIKNKKVLVLAPYPIKKPYHGGQKRAKAIFDFYSVHSQEAKFVAVFHRGQYTEWSKNDLPLGDPKLISQIDDNPYTSEIVTGLAIDKDLHVRSYMAELLREFNPDIIHIEQPYPYLGLKPLMDEIGFKSKIILGSQNIEFTLKQNIAKNLKVNKKIAHETAAITKRLEIDLSKTADIVVAVNQEDADEHVRLGATRCTVVPNGIELSKPKDKAVRYWDEFKSTNRVDTIITFVGSGHPPNWAGFESLVGRDLSFLPSNCKLVVAGGVSNFFEQELTPKLDHKDFWSKAHLEGMIEEDLLQALLSISDVIILPIITKRGSNLKTAEAMLSQKKIAITSCAFHGFEKFRKLPNVYIGDSKSSFRKAISDAINSDYVSPTNHQKKLVQQVKWENCLIPLKREIERMYLIDKIKKLLRKARNSARPQFWTQIFKKS